MVVAPALPATGGGQGNIAGELVRGLGNHLHYELVGDDFAAGCQPFTEGIGLIQLGDDAASIRGVRGLQILEGRLPCAATMDGSKEREALAATALGPKKTA